MVKKTVAMFLVLVLFVIVSVTVVYADSAERTSGPFKYRLKGNGTAIITSYDWSYMGDVFVPEMIDGYTVTEIGPYAFSSEGNQNIGMKMGKSFFVKDGTDEKGAGVSFTGVKMSSSTNGIAVSLPDSLKIIGEGAFFSTGITSCIIPKSVEHIGYGAFAGCINLRKHSVHSENQTFASIDGVLYNKKTKELLAYPIPYDDSAVLSDFIIPDGIVSIGDYAFYGLDYVYNDDGHYNDAVAKPRNGRNIVLPSTVTNIGNYAFAYAVIGNPNTADNSPFDLGNVKTIGGNAFECSLIYSFVNPEHLEKIGEKCFFCTTFVSVENNVLVLPESLTEIPNYSFEGWSGDNIYTEKRHELQVAIKLPRTLQYIGIGAFKNNYHLTEATFSDTTQLRKIDSEAFYSAQVDGNKRIVLPEGIEEIGAKAFYTDGIEYLYIPSSVKKLEDGFYNKNIAMLEVEKDSYAEFYASENGLQYVLTSGEDTSWLNN